VWAASASRNDAACSLYARHTACVCSLGSPTCHARHARHGGDGGWSEEDEDETASLRHCIITDEHAYASSLRAHASGRLRSMHKPLSCLEGAAARRRRRRQEVAGCATKA
jgi:hypothetical protein